MLSGKQESAMAFGRKRFGSARDYAAAFILSAVAVAAVEFIAFAGRPSLGLLLAAGVVFVVVLIWYRRKSHNHA
jgi:hypothetical protein